MKKISLFLLTVCLILLPLISACGQIITIASPPPSPTPIPPTFTATPITPTATVTSTPDPCATENISEGVKPVHQLMREFDDAVAIAGNTGRELLSAQIVELQRIRREAENQSVPACLKTLKEFQLAHMNTLIQAMLSFMGGTEQDMVGQGIILSRQLHNQYMIELSKLMGETVVAIPTNPVIIFEIPIETLEENADETSTPPPPTPTVPVVTNPGPTSALMLIAPAMDSQTVGILEVGQSALALGLSPDSLWVMIEIPNQPGQVAWVYASLVQMQGSGTLTIIPAAP